MMKLPYEYIIGKGNMMLEAYEDGKKKKNQQYRIMVGHSGTPGDNQLINLKRLYSYHDKEIIKVKKVKKGRFA